MSDLYQRGDLLPVRWTPSGGAAIVLSITGWGGSLLESLSLDVTSTRHNGFRARFGGVQDGKGNVTAFLDLDNAPWAAGFSIKNGQLGLLEPFVKTDQTRNFAVPVLIPRVNYKSAIQEALSWNFDWELSVLAGAFTYPT